VNETEVINVTKNAVKKNIIEEGKVMIKGSRHEEFRSGSFKTSKKKKINSNFKSEILPSNVNDQWVKKKDIAIWIGILLIIIVTIINVHRPTYSNKIIYLDGKVNSLKEALKITDAEVLKINKKAKLDGIDGYIDGSQNIINKKPRLSIYYTKSNKGLINNIEDEISVSVDLDTQEISGIFCSRNTTYGFNRNDFLYNKSKLEINDIYDIINKKIDMKEVINGYKPSIDFNMHDNKCLIYVTYYKNKDADESKNDSRVEYTIEVDLRTKDIKKFSKKE
jgi:hypothetical protein